MNIGMLKRSMGSILGVAGRGVKTAAYAFNDGLLDGRGIAQGRIDRASDLRATKSAERISRRAERARIPVRSSIRDFVKSKDGPILMTQGQDGSFGITHNSGSISGGYRENMALQVRGNTLPVASSKGSNYSVPVGPISKTPFKGSSKASPFAGRVGDLRGKASSMGTADKTFRSFTKNLSQAFGENAMSRVAKYATFGGVVGAGTAAAGALGSAIDPDAVQGNGIVKSGVRGAMLGAMFGSARPLGYAMGKTKSSNAFAQSSIRKLGGFVKTTADHPLSKAAIGVSMVAGSASVHLTAPVNRINNR